MQEVKFFGDTARATIRFSFPLYVSLLENLQSRKGSILTYKNAENGSIVKKHYNGMYSLVFVSPLSRYQKHFLTCPFDQQPEN